MMALFNTPSSTLACAHDLFEGSKMDGNLIVFAFICSVALASVGSKIAGGEPWKGGALAVGFIVGSMIAAAFGANLIMSLLAGAVVAALLPSILKLPNRAAANAFLGTIIGHLLPIFFA
jgi:hypothetical protein